MGYTDITGSAGDPFLVLDIFTRPDSVPKERLLIIKNPKRLFWQMWFNIIRLRGLQYIFSLKDVKQFKLYKVRVFSYVYF